MVSVVGLLILSLGALLEWKEIICSLIMDKTH